MSDHEPLDRFASNSYRGALVQPRQCFKLGLKNFSVSGLTFIEKVARQSWVLKLVINIFVSVRRYFKVDEKTGEVFSLVEFQENLVEENQDTSFNLIINARSES